MQTIDLLREDVKRITQGENPTHYRLIGNHPELLRKVTLRIVLNTALNLEIPQYENLVVLGLGTLGAAMAQCATKASGSTLRNTVTSYILEEEGENFRWRSAPRMPLHRSRYVILLSEVIDAGGSMQHKAAALVAKSKGHISAIGVIGNPNKLTAEELGVAHIESFL